MSIIQSDHLISRCSSCGGWQWRGRCKTCEQPVVVDDLESA